MNTAKQHISPLKASTPRTVPVLASNDLADMQRLTIREVSVLVGRSASNIRELIAEKRFPAADYRDGPRCVRWSAGLVKRWLAQTTTQGPK
ncbi:phage transcriptional regulator, AlpA [Leptothrix cholodnii SP-6]|uniref:Phage transcriptional regulator, AlpA n=1 Tax=Leptothrix cholodnii (strain ATCC 51168 / LMG 8142 / SP-6) TaxID=395495 RepID=B1XZ70_LEPCP|nr:phage transcriptional regulator, AlpA [Leptothrix cholodnii SP-6]